MATFNASLPAPTSERKLDRPEDPLVILRYGEVVLRSEAIAWGEPYVLAPVQV
jgi:hypothetical protein